ncbi:hypothetical protein jhhlp_008092 [Lomentospora prolificans]|uniref:Uncharacterized protein n=1 Tax=Lomentospora prolificans TaxID=41688 RepID=A0A2N3MZF9_9PEZI|nr:hypothetical protein jhhlp_008092 [Lomentospora prolificans]
MSTTTTTTTTGIELASVSLTHINASNTPQNPKRNDVDSSQMAGIAGSLSAGACAVIIWWAIGTCYSWGVMQEALVTEGLSSPAVLSFISGLDAAFIFALAIAVRLGCLIGVGLIEVSEILSGFAVTKLGALFLLLEW